MHTSHKNTTPRSPASRLNVDHQNSWTVLKTWTYVFHGTPLNVSAAECAIPVNYRSLITCFRHIIAYGSKLGGRVETSRIKVEFRCLNFTERVGLIHASEGKICPGHRLPVTSEYFDTLNIPFLPPLF